MAGRGQLNISVDVDSPVLQDSLPLVVRDAHLAVVHEGTVGGTDIYLPEGLYSVEVTAPDGALSSSVVRVRTHETVRVRVPGNTQLPTAPPIGVTWAGGAFRGPPDVGDLFIRRSRGLGVRGGSPVNVTPVATLVEARDCSVLELSAGGWEFLPEKPATTVATAVFALGRKRVEMSLAVNPEANRADLAACRVDQVPDRDGVDRLRMSFPPGRSLCTTLAGLLRNNAASSAVNLLADATEALMSKYDDPTGAALGALTLHGLGRLNPRATWVANLARDFPWLPDGRILDAALSMKSYKSLERQAGLQSLLSATTRRPLYTDGLSLAMELLRRWPDEDSAPARQERLDGLADYVAYADWDSVNLSVDVTDRER
jgi:hypothetical protein